MKFLGNVLAVIVGLFIFTILSTLIFFGIIGMIIAIPLYTILKVFGKEFYPENKIIQLLTKDI